MKYTLQILFGLMLMIFPLCSHAMFTELGLTYGRKRTTFDANNDSDSEYTTASVSLYFAERMALELSYTDAATVQHQQLSSADLPRTIYQKSDILGADLVYIFADKTAVFQPFVKAGIAQIKRNLEYKDGSFPTQTTPIPDNSIAPSYGVGFKVAVTDAFGIKASYSVWQTPIGNGQKTNDDAISAGVTWMF